MYVGLGAFIVFAAIIGGYWMAGGPFLVLLQPAELIIIGGAAVGAFVISATPHVLKLTVGNLHALVSPRRVDRSMYLDALVTLNRLLLKIRREGLAAVETDIENPKMSSLFARSLMSKRDPAAVDFICDTMRVFLITGDAGEVDQLMHLDVEAMHAQAQIPAHNLNRLAESLPGLGIVAAVLGVVLTMGKITAPPEVLGQSIGAALVGTFLGVLGCYGLVGPLAANLENQAKERETYLTVIQAVLTGAAQGATPIVALEYGRRSIPELYRPSFGEFEELVKRG